MTVQVALLGAGRIGKVHAETIAANRNASLYAISDPVKESAAAISNSHGCKIMTIDEAASDSEVDAVVICTPTDMHANLIIKFAQSGKAVFCEKPIDLRIERVRECLEIVKGTKTTLMVGFNRRFDPHFSALKKTIDEGTIGEVELVHITSRDPEAPPEQYIRSSGGIFKDMTIHDFDMARFLLTEEPTTVFATGSVLTDPGIAELQDFDSASVVITTSSGKQCTISNSRRATYGYDQRIEVHGSKGSVSAENQRPVSIEVASESGFTRPRLHHFFMTRYLEAYAAEIETFLNSVREGKKPSPNGQDGYMALLLAEAAVKSVQEKRQVEISELLV